MSNLSSIIKSIQDIMRQDSGVDGDAQRLSQLTWLLFLKVFDALEEELGFGVIDIVSPARSALHIPNKNSVKQLLAHPAQYIVAIGLAARGMADL